MRIIQLSDIHLSNSNINNLQNYYMSALISDLKSFHDETPIDVILITGDLVDKGGNSIGNDCYKTFDDEFINPIITELGISKDAILFIPGNHDIDRAMIDEENEYYLANKLTKEAANEKIKGARNEFDKTNNRIKKIKEFEKEFHSTKKDYIFSNYESLSIESSLTYKIGFALVNDSWRCSNELQKEQHFIGTEQLFNANKYFRQQKTDLNIAVFHHPLDAINSGEAEEIENILKSQNFDIAFFGHSHEHKIESIISSSGGILTINGRSAFNSPQELNSKFQPGFNILDLDIAKKNYVLHARKFISNNGYRFDKDVDSLKDGVFEGSFEKKQEYVHLSKTQNDLDKELPSGYSADVNRIVKLLIGKSLYTNPFIFVRELIQNAVDACHRVSERNSDYTPKIIVNINTDIGYFEVTDHGDGMSKKVLKEHFAVIGKSISQEFNDSNGNFNLISQFGIGFISTFIVAQKVMIATKSESDDLVQFEITDVFKGFNYNVAENYMTNELIGHGTKVRVYLKKEFRTINLFGYARSYCRHISNIEFNVNSVLQPYNESWNMENTDHNFHLKNLKYDIRLGISLNQRAIVSSNSGFLINQHSANLIPHKFPYIIGGEVNFNPKAIDFDISRSNIIDTEKSRDFKKEISVSLRHLFRYVLESRNQPLIQTVLTYIQGYLCIFDHERPSFLQSYSDFYSKNELIEICLKYLSLEFEYYPQKLETILAKLRSQNINKIYFRQGNSIDDYESIVAKYLQDQGNFILSPANFNIQFRQESQTVNTLQVIQIIAQDQGFFLIGIENVNQLDITDMKINKNTLPAKVSEQLAIIEQTYSVKIDVTRFNRSSKPVIRLSNQFFINYEHLTFQSLLLRSEVIPEGTLKTYFLGVLGLSIDMDS